MKLKLIALITTSLVATSAYCSSGYKILDDHTTISNGLTGGVKNISTEFHPNSEKKNEDPSATSTAEIYPRVTGVMVLTPVSANFDYELNTGDLGAYIFEVEMKISTSDGKMIDRIYHPEVNHGTFKARDLENINVMYEQPQVVVTKAEIWIRDYKKTIFSDSKAMSTVTVNK